MGERGLHGALMTIKRDDVCNTWLSPGLGTEETFTQL